MSDDFTVKVEGVEALHDALGEFTKSTERTLLRRIAVKALGPVVEHAKRLAPVDDGDLRDSIRVGSKLTRRAKSAAKGDPREGVRVFAGTTNRNGVPREFGSVRSPAEPFMRPAWDSGKRQVLADVTDQLAGEIERTRKRVAARAAKAKG